MNALNRFKTIRN